MKNRWKNMDEKNFPKDTNQKIPFKRVLFICQIFHLFKSFRMKNIQLNMNFLKIYLTSGDRD